MQDEPRGISLLCKKEQNDFFRELYSLLFLFSMISKGPWSLQHIYVQQGGTLCQCIGPPSRYFAICDCTIPKANIKNIMMLALLLSRAATFYPNPKSTFVAFIVILAICLCTLVTQPKSIEISIVYIPLERYFIRLQF